MSEKHYRLYFRTAIALRRSTDVRHTFHSKSIAMKVAELMAKDNKEIKYLVFEVNSAEAKTAKEQ